MTSTREKSFWGYDFYILMLSHQAIFPDGEKRVIPGNTRLSPIGPGIPGIIQYLGEVSSRPSSSEEEIKGGYNCSGYEYLEIKKSHRVLFPNGEETEFPIGTRLSMIVGLGGFGKPIPSDLKDNGKQCSSCTC